MQEMQNGGRMFIFADTSVEMQGKLREVDANFLGGMAAIANDETRGRWMRHQTN